MTSSYFSWSIWSSPWARELVELAKIWGSPEGIGLNRGDTVISETGMTPDPILLR